MKTFKGKAIYNPAGKAAEYAEWACNFYTGCSNDCDYCYCKRGVMSSVWDTTPKLKKCFKDENHALEVFEKELISNLPELHKHGLFFSFTTDPMLKETAGITMYAIVIAINKEVPVKILTKIDCADFLIDATFKFQRDKIAVGFTLTGNDELEPNASSNAERIEAMRKLHEAGFKTWASIEPVIDFDSSYEIIKDTNDFCDLFKIGLMSGKKYEKSEVFDFIDKTLSYAAFFFNDNTKIYFKDSLLAQSGINREDLPENCVGRDWNMFND